MGCIQSPRYGQSPAGGGGWLTPFCWLHRCVSSLKLFSCEEH